MRRTSWRHWQLPRSSRPIVVALALTLVPGAAILQAQEDSAQPAAKQPVRPGDYGRFERLGSRTPLSPDGGWLAVPITRVDGTSELRTYSVSDAGSPVVAEEGRDPVFSEDSVWLAYRVGHSESAREQLQEQDEPIEDSLGLLRLSSAEAEIVDRVASFGFGAGGAYVAMHRYPPSSEDESDTDRRGADLVVRGLAGGAELTIGNVAEYAWQTDGSLLAVAIETDDGLGNGVQLYDAATGSLPGTSDEADSDEDSERSSRRRSRSGTPTTNRSFPCNGCARSATRRRAT